MADLIFIQGADSGVKWDIFDKAGNPIDFNGWSGEMQVRAFNSDKLLHTFSTVIGNLVLTSNSEVVITYTNAESSAWKWNQAAYGLELTNPQGKKARPKEGIVTLSKETVK